MRTNAGVKIIDEEGIMPGFTGTMYANDSLMATIFAMRDLIKQYRVTFDSEKEDVFNVHTKDGLMKFEASKEGLYIYKLPEQFMKGIKSLNNNPNEIMERS